MAIDRDKTLNRKTLQYHPELYPEHAFLHHEIARRMVDYLDETLTPKHILVDGAFDHYLSELLQARFPEAIIAENIESLTDATARFDLIISNLYLQDVWEFEERVRDYQVRLNAHGKLFFTTIGTGSFPDVSYPGGPVMNEYPDIEDIGDYLHALGFKNSVLFIEKINLTYEKLDTLLKDARIVAGKPFSSFKGLRTYQWLEEWRAYAEKLKNSDNLYDIGFDIIYAEGSLSEIKNLQGMNNEVFVDITNLSTKPKSDS
ncbi:methyltransferase domain-containing protein [Ignatzschineria sp. LJL83]